jgi:choline kinase
MLIDPRGARVLDWVLSSLRPLGVDDVAFVGGYQIGEIGQQYPDLHFYYNPQWDRTSVLESLLCAEPAMEEGFFLSYADIVFRPAVAQALYNRIDADLALVVDTRWLDRHHNRSRVLQASAEKVVVEDGRVTRIGKRLNRGENATGEFIGLAWVGPRASELLRKHYHAIKDQYLHRPFHEARSIRNAFLTDMLQELIDLGLTITPVEISGDWAEINSRMDVAQFVFGTKAETLERLQSVLSPGHVCDQVRFTVEDWSSKPGRCVAEIRRRFSPRDVVVRSSALSEDGWTSSMAGAYRSILGVSPDSEEALRSAVEAVIQSYRAVEDCEPNGRHQILVQPHLRDVALAGVLLTSALEDRAPYFVVNYDDVTSRTDTVTAGNGSPSRTVMVHKHSHAPLPDPRLKPVVDAARQLETIIGFDALDVEFAVDSTGQLYILQVRPIAVDPAEACVDADIHDELAGVSAFVHDRMQRVPHVRGVTTILGDMPDWNPAEMIGTRPNPLALSLYQYLITDRAWSDARARIGYFDPFPERLMVSLGGHPYVDVRNSFNNLTPAALPAGLAERLIDHYLERLRSNPELHDKVEFELVHSCLGFDFEEQVEPLRSDDFDVGDLNLLRQALFELTEGVLSGRVEPIHEQLARIEQLKERRSSLIGESHRLESLPRLVMTLLDDCIRFGTLPFSILARYAFIGDSLLRSLRRRGVLSAEDYHGFLQSIGTVATDLVQDVSRLQRGEIEETAFLEQYGHLRPGTYDILSPSYEERPELYLCRGPSAGSPPEPIRPSARFQASPACKGAIAGLLGREGFSCSPDELLQFIREAIVGRELAKFEFTRNVSRAIGLLAEYGEGMGFSREEMSRISVRDVEELSASGSLGDSRERLARAMEANATRMAICRRIHLPHLIRSVEQIQAFEVSDSRPNLVTGKRVTAPCVVLAGAEARPELSQRIVLIESADPGFDWIFMHGIAGLVTRYGGPASHMAIRCAEFGIPAAIGCGELLFNRLRSAQRIELDCGAGHVRPV